MYIIKQIPEDFVVREKKQLVLHESGVYSYFLLRKRDYTTEKAVAFIAKQLQIPRKYINYAGTKDRRAVTEQYVSIRGYAPRFQEYSQEKIFGDLTLRYLGRGNERLNLGSHEGNAFVITLRNLTAVDINCLQNQLAVLRALDYHLPNYFDAQRFSSQNVAIGLALLRQNREEAAKLMNPLTANPTDNPWEEIRAKPKRILQFYIHSVQSALYNRIVADFIQQKLNKYNGCVMVNDLLFPLKQLSSAVYECSAPLVGFGTPDELETYDPVIKAFTRQIMQEYKLTYRDFIVRKLPQISSEGTSRRSFFTVDALTVGTPELDELNVGRQKVRISFTLPQGSYATMVIRFLFMNASEENEENRYLAERGKAP